MLELGMITAPRKHPTIQQSITSLRNAGFIQPIHVFAEPESACTETADVLIRYNPERRGCFLNFHHALTTLLAETSQPYLCILQDDILMGKNAWPYLRYILETSEKPFGYYSLVSYKHDIFHMKAFRPGWHACTLGWNSWGGNYVMMTPVARKMVQQPFYQRHLKHYVHQVRNQQIDACVSETCLRMGLDTYLHTPSLSDHIGEESTIGHGDLTDERQAYEFDPELDFLKFIPIRHRAEYSAS